jgi:hypothetical protein
MNELRDVAGIAERTTNANWNSAFRSMDFWATKKLEGDTVPPGMVKLAHEARYFIHKYQDFFSKVTFRPEEKDEYNNTLVQHHALGIALEEWDTIRHALEQRENSRYQKTLGELDKLAIECLSPIFNKENIESVEVYTYLHKLFDIKRFAFSHTPLIGAPYEALNAPEAWLAIPHEAGHYVYWNGTKSFEAFNRFYVGLQNSILKAIEIALQNRIKGGYFRRTGEVFQTWMNWLNEIFADIFGTLIAGPAYAWSMQSNLRAPISIRDLYHSHEEGDHPNPFIRPFFHILTLRNMADESEGNFADQLKAEADSLENSWKRSWFEADNDIDRLPTPDNIGKMTDILENEVPMVVSAVLNANLGDNLPKTMLEYFKEGVLYNSALHNQVTEIASQIVDETYIPPAEPEPPLSPLVKGMAAQLAIVQGKDPVLVHKIMGYGGAEAIPEPDENLDKEFDEFVANVTGEDDPQNQRESWRRVLGYSLVEQAFAHHHHGHSH